MSFPTEALPASEHPFPRLFEAALNGLTAEVAILDKDGAILSVNDAWRRFAAENAPSPAALNEGANYLRVCDAAGGDEAEQGHEVSAGIRAVIAGTLPLFTMEYPCDLIAGPQWFALHVTPVSGEGPARAVVSHENITAYKQFQAALLDGKRQIQTIADTVPMLIARVGADCRYQFANVAYEKWFALPADRIVGRTVAEVLGEANYSRVLPSIRRALAGEEASLDALLDYPEIGLRQVQVRYVPEFAPDGVVTGFLVVVWDMTERMRLREQMLRSERLAAMGAMVAGMAHEINNPLAAIRGLGQLLQRHPDPQVQEDAATIQQMTDRAGGIIRSLRTFAHQTEEAARFPVSLRSLVSETLEMSRFKPRESNIEVVADFAEPDLMPEINAARIEQALLHLIDNAEYALQARESDRRITLTTRQGQNMGREYAVITVSDNGSGIPDSVKEQIFDPFFTTRPQGEGTGLGLSICHGIAAAHGGYLTVSSEVGIGTEVTLSLPLKQEPPSPSRNARAAA